MGDSMIACFWNDAHLFPPPKDGSSYLLMARIGEERPWPVVGHWDSVDEWRSTRSRWIVLASKPVASVMRLAARPVDHRSLELGKGDR
jgi:hypothetical protein